MLWSELRLILKTSSVTPDFFYVFHLILSFSTVSQSFKEICVWEVFWARTSLSKRTDSHLTTARAVQIPKYGQIRTESRLFIPLKCLSKQPERWSCWYTLDQYSDLIGFTNKMKNMKAETDMTYVFIVHLQKNILRCVGFCLHIHLFIPHALQWSHDVPYLLLNQPVSYHRYARLDFQQFWECGWNAGSRLELFADHKRLPVSVSDYGS